MSDSDDDYDPGTTRVVMASAARVPPLPSSAAAPLATVQSTPTVAVTVTSQATLGRNLASPGREPATVEESEDGGLRLHGIKGRVRCLCMNPSGSLLCAGGDDGHMSMWDFSLPLPSRRLEPTRVLTPFVNRISGLQPIVAMHCASNGRYIVACQDGDSPVLVSATSGKQLGYCAMGERGLVDVVRCKGHRAPVTSSAPHCTIGARFYTAAQDGTVRLWDQASYDRGSVFAIKHGSGQINDTVVVESVLGLRHQVHLFASGGEDGFVQLWDSRVKYRPGGSVASWDVYAMTLSGALHGDVFEKHIGGIVELGDGGTTLAVRRGDVVQFLDLRTKGKGMPMPALAGLPSATDTTQLFATGPHGFITGTSRTGFQHMVGGHVVSYEQMAADTPSMAVRRAWRAGRVDEDVLCACADADGRVFAGLSTGDVVVKTNVGGAVSAKPSVESWLASRPAREGSSGRVVGQKALRPEGDGETGGTLF